MARSKKIRCPDPKNQIFHPTAHRCVSRQGRLGLEAAQIKAQYPTLIDACPPGSDFNPLTGRCARSPRRSPAIARGVGSAVAPATRGIYSKERLMQLTVRQLEDMVRAEKISHKTQLIGALIAKKTKLI